MIILQNIDYLGENYDWHKNVDIVIESHLIKSIRPHQARFAEDAQIIKGKNKLVLPGFFNLHSHVPMTLLRGYGEGLDLESWLFERIFPFEDLMTADDMYWGALLGISEFLASGVVSFSDMYMRVQGIVKAVKESAIKANLCNPLGVMDPSADYSQTNSYQEEIYMLDYISKNKDSKIIVDAGIHGEYTSSPESVAQVLEFAQTHDLNIQIHISETQQEHEECKKRNQGKTPTQYFNDLGVLDRKCILAHGVYLEEKDLQIIKEKNAVLVHNPASNLKLGSGFANIQKWFEHGIQVCLGTDGPASNNDLDIIQDMRLAALLVKGLNKNPKLISTNQILDMLTINGAEAQNRANSGQIKPGQAADLIIVDLDTPNMQPIYDLQANLVYSMNQKNIYLTMVDGKILYQNGEYKTIDIEKVKAQVNRIKKEKLNILNP